MLVYNFLPVLCSDWCLKTPVLLTDSPEFTLFLESNYFKPFWWYHFFLPDSFISFKFPFVEFLRFDIEEPETFVLWPAGQFQDVVSLLSDWWSREKSHWASRFWQMAFILTRHLTLESLQSPPLRNNGFYNSREGGGWTGGAGQTEERIKKTKFRPRRKKQTEETQKLSEQSEGLTNKQTNKRWVWFLKRQ